MRNDDFTQFHNIINEFYDRDTSRKIKSVFKAKGTAGKHMTGLMYCAEFIKTAQKPQKGTLSARP